MRKQALPTHFTVSHVLCRPQGRGISVSISSVIAVGLKTKQNKKVCYKLKKKKKEELDFTDHLLKVHLLKSIFLLQINTSHLIISSSLKALLSSFK